ncbi:MAG: glycosyltransferase [Mojavia pulchra JT2-VF2]|jgi:glycosyltransferase involved in cell wall biosynthesis|uniref:Glycosyltransferase n=1 Tax=Mojavia pulchra JT2-VF2 TaxID=287848 RepID=A0A951PZS3_9NOST|nr:glycosyltransferase [Mojavia pulchra JT2-VF2]
MEIPSATEYDSKKNYPQCLEGGLRLSHDYQKKSQINQPLITIITVVFNGEKHIEDTIKSVIKQKNEHISYIVIDGGSNDNTLKIIKKYETDIEYWISEPDKGIYDAMNKGWAVADDNSHILFLGAGDLILSLPTVNQMYSNKAIFGRVSLGDNGFFKSTSGWKLKLGNTLHHQALLIHKSLSMVPPFNTQYKVYADYDFNARLFNDGVNFVFSDSFIAYALPDGLTSKLYIHECLKIIEKNFGIIWKVLAAIYYLYQGTKYGFRRISIFS